LYYGMSDNNEVSQHISYSGKILDDGLFANDPQPISQWNVSSVPGLRTSLRFNDPPSNPVPLNYTYVDIDSNFTTYLMYNPGQNYSGVWVALYQVTWSVDLRANQGNWGLTTAPPAPAANASPTSGASFFPTWTNDTENLTWQQGL
ncbi:MAG TPA: hypothetical protein VFT74_17290, partial [Isosphaeraceae bacterium]|nr:hypothetical protein [Isosphaeraceae bacterium]